LRAFFTFSPNSKIKAQNNPDAIHNGNQKITGGSPRNKNAVAASGHEITKHTTVHILSKIVSGGYGGRSLSGNEQTKKNRLIATIVTLVVVMRILLAFLCLANLSKIGSMRVRPI
jgi:hypothetical protein